MCMSLQTEAVLQTKSPAAAGVHELGNWLVDRILVRNNQQHTMQQREATDTPANAIPRAAHVLKQITSHTCHQQHTAADEGCT